MTLRNQKRDFLRVVYERTTKDEITWKICPTNILTTRILNSDWVYKAFKAELDSDTRIYLILKKTPSTNEDGEFLYDHIHIELYVMQDARGAESKNVLTITTNDLDPSELSLLYSVIEDKNSDSTDFLDDFFKKNK